jgi:hypothetical protein
MFDPVRIELTRQELYEKVWSISSQKLAKELGISDVALAKWCRKLNVPKPGLGDWRRMETGKPVKKPKLPQPERTDKLRLTIRHPQQPASEKPAIPEFELFEMNPDNKIVVPESLDRPHDLVKQTRKAIREKDYSTPKLDIAVTDECRNRSYLILDALLKALNSRGIVVEVRQRERRIDHNTCAVINGMHIPFSIYEPSERREVKGKSGKDTTTELVPTGRLVLRVNAK